LVESKHLFANIEEIFFTVSNNVKEKVTLKIDYSNENCTDNNYGSTNNNDVNIPTEGFTFIADDYIIADFKQMKTVKINHKIAEFYDSRKTRNFFQTKAHYPKVKYSGFKLKKAYQNAM
jgi:hypothetical protein